jgi:integrase
MGYVYQRGRKLWIGFKDAAGKPQRQPTEFVMGEEAKARVLVERIEARLKAQEAFEPVAFGRVTGQRYFERWLERRRARGLSSVDDDETRLGKHALHDLGPMKIEDVRTRHIRDLFHSFLPNVPLEMAPKQVHLIKGLLHKMFKDAVVDELISANPVVLAEEDLPPKVDKDPDFRRLAIFARAEVEMLISDERIPLHRRVRYALIFLGGVRVGEASGLRWSDYEAGALPLGRLTISRQWHTKKRQFTPIKTARRGIPTREMPVHPLLATILAEWKLGGWAQTFGRVPCPEDLISPKPYVPGKGRRTGGANVAVPSKRVWEELHDDCAMLGLRHRRTHDLRRTFISLARQDGARSDILKWGTHGRQRVDIMDAYTEVFWQPLCAEVGKLKIERRDANAVVLPMVAAGGSRSREPLVARTDSDALGCEGPRGGAAGQLTAQLTVPRKALESVEKESGAGGNRTTFGVKGNHSRDARLRPEPKRFEILFIHQAPLESAHFHLEPQSLGNS